MNFQKKYKNFKIGEYEEARKKYLRQVEEIKRQNEINETNKEINNKIINPNNIIEIGAHKNAIMNKYCNSSGNLNKKIIEQWERDRNELTLPNNIKYKTIDLTKIKHYFLTVEGNEKRKQHIMNDFSNSDMKCIDTIKANQRISKFQSGALGISRLIDIGLREQNNDTFTPFLVLEDDVSKIRDYPDIIKIPDDSDLFYVGNSSYGIGNTYVNSELISIKHLIYARAINKEIIRIYNMLSTHAILICSASGALAYQKSMMESYFKNIHYDITLAQIQPYYNVYALKKPLIYQDGKIGGEQEATQTTIENYTHKIPNDHIKKDNISILMCQR